MACVHGCNDCKCVEVDVTKGKENAFTKLNDKLRVLFEVVCYIGNVPCARLPSLMAKVVYMIWCLLKDLVNFQVNNEGRLAALEKKVTSLESRVTALEKK